jgi:hypothetical protein
LAALDELSELRAAAGDGAIAATLDAHTTYLAALLGEQTSLAHYIALTQGCAARGWSPSYLDYRGQLAQDSLAALGIKVGRGHLEGTKGARGRGARIPGCVSDPRVR